MTLEEAEGTGVKEGKRRSRNRMPATSPARNPHAKIRNAISPTKLRLVTFNLDRTGPETKNYS